MNTLVLRAEDPAALDQAAAILRQGGLVAFPTETVYGLGALGLDAVAVERIFQAKGRPHSDPVILHVAEAEGVRPLVREFPEVARRLAEAFWPGPLTLVLPKSDLVPSLVTAGRDSVAVRMPAHPVARELIGRVGAPIAAPSANLFSRTSPTTAHHVLADLEGRIDAVLDGGPADVGVESTVLDLRGAVPVVLRPGGVSREAIEAALGQPVGEFAPPSGKEDEGNAGLVSPGLLTRHYSPRAEMRLYQGPDRDVLAAMQALAGEASDPAKIGILVYAEDQDVWQRLPVKLGHLGSRYQPEEVARRLYAELRTLDASGVTLILARAMPSGGLGDAVNDRLRRAASGQVTDLTPGAA